MEENITELRKKLIEAEIELNEKENTIKHLRSSIHIYASFITVISCFILFYEPTKIEIIDAIYDPSVRTVIGSIMMIIFSLFFLFVLFFMIIIGEAVLNYHIECFIERRKRYSKKSFWNSEETQNILSVISGTAIAILAIIIYMFNAR